MAGPRAAVTREMLAEARAIAEEGRQSHVTWAEHLEGHEGGAPCARCTADVTAATGDAAHNRDWVRKYDALLAVIAYVEGLQPDTLYMPVPRCGSCAWWQAFDERSQPATVGGIVERLMADGLMPPEMLQNLSVRLGDCTLFECRGKSQVHDESMLIVTRTRSGEATIVTQADFGCVQWKARDAAG